MESKNWEEVEKEFIKNESGNLELYKVRVARQSESWHFGLQKKDFIEYVFRTIGALAIFVPLLLFYLQQQAEIKKQKILYQLDIYSSTTSTLHTILNKRTTSIEFENGKNKLFYELYPKLNLLNDSVIIHQFNSIRDHLELYAIVANACDEADTITLLAGSLDIPILEMTGPYRKQQFKEDSTLIQNAILRLREDIALFSKTAKKLNVFSSTNIYVQNLKDTFGHKIDTLQSKTASTMFDLEAILKSFGKENSNSEPDNSFRRGLSDAVLAGRFRKLASDLEQRKSKLFLVLDNLADDLDKLMIKSNAVFKM